MPLKNMTSPSTGRSLIDACGTRLWCNALPVASLNHFKDFTRISSLSFARLVVMSQPKAFTYSTITGYFLQDELATIAESFDFVATNFGLLERDYDSDVCDDSRGLKTQWQRFEQEFKRLNETADPDMTYKVLYVGRHGEGNHNVAERRYGREEWDGYWAAQEGDSTAHWADAHLTELGIQQAQAVNTFWKHQVAEARTPLPERYYTSPMYRCLETANHTFADLDLPAEKPYKPVVKEFLREVNGVHTCDRRSPKSALVAAFPNFTFEPGFAENDELWTPDHRETNAEIDERMQRLLDDIFRHDSTTFISFTCHSGAISSLLRVLGHREFRLPTGAVIPVLVKAVKVN
ncbi:MAG: hypothetical protein Q9201_005321 [Fulgogasparrea decipioides]